jgi:hypothetical protein
MAQSPDVSVREAEGITKIAESAREAESYNRIYASALPIARSGNDSSLNVFFGAIKSQFDEADKKYNYALSKKAGNTAALEVEKEEAKYDY